MSGGSGAPVSFSEAGKRTRMGRIFGADGRCVVLPLDHGTVLGRPAGLEDPLAVLDAFLDSRCDGFLLGPGLMRRSADRFARRDAPARLFTLDQHFHDGTSVGHRPAGSVELAAALGADAVKLLMPWDLGAGERSRSAALAAGVIAAAEPVGMPVMLEPVAVATEPGPGAVAVVGDGCRAAVELGADIVKLAHPGDADLLAAWASESGVPLVLLGGPAVGSAEELVATVEEAVAAGASGIVIGRRVWQRPLEEARALLERLAAVVHDRPQAGSSTS